VGGREINEFGVLLYVNTPEQKQNRRRKAKERKGKERKEERVHAQLL
jgi:hypothetical protein